MDLSKVCHAPSNFQSSGGDVAAAVASTDAEAAACLLLLLKMAAMIVTTTSMVVLALVMVMVMTVEPLLCWRRCRRVKASDRLSARPGSSPANRGIEAQVVPIRCHAGFHSTPSFCALLRALLTELCRRRRRVLTVSIADVQNEVLCVVMFISLGRLLLPPPHLVGGPGTRHPRGSSGGGGQA